jgi:hypothetical protein
MNAFKWTIRPFLCLGLLQAVSCTKKMDTVAHDSVNVQTSSDLTFPVTNEFSNCKLRYIVHEHGGVSGLLVTGLFTYNSAGNPISLTYGEQTGSGNPNHYFRYDSKKRLREWLQAYSPEDPMESILHKYGYNSNNLLVVDSAFHFAEFGGEGFKGYADTIVSAITYDSQGRVVKEAIRNVKGGTTRYPTYTYDSRGNLGVLGWKSSWYDTKVSFVRSHPIFMFLMRNYSKNGPWTLSSNGQKYNSRGLPLSIKYGNDTFFGAGFTIEKLIYDCQ